MGNHANGDSEYDWGGLIDDFRIYDGALDAAAIQALYDSGMGPLAPVIVSSAPTAAPAGVPYSYAVSAIGNPAPAFSWSTNVSWLSLAGNVLSGTPASGDVGTTPTITVTATNSQGSTQQQFAIEVVYVPPPEGRILREWWTGIGGNAVSYLTGNAAYPDSPTGTSYQPMFEGPTNWADDYGTRLRGYVHPPQDGQYVFWIASDDRSELWLSTDDDPANLRVLPICSVPDYTDPRQWGKFAQQMSVPIALQSGRRYYIEALQAEGGGGDNVAVGWRLPDGTHERPVPGSRLSPWCDPGPPVITSVAMTSAAVDAPYVYAITAAGNPPPEVAVTEGVAWLSYDPATRTLSGTPSATGTTGTITVTATSTAGSDQQQFTITVYDVDPDLLGWWKLDESSGLTAADSSGNGNAGTLQNMTGSEWTAGQVAGGLAFLDDNDQVSTPLSIDQSSSSAGATFSAWVYPTSAASGDHFVVGTDNTGYDWGIMQENGLWKVFTGEERRPTGFAADLNTWQHAIAVFDAAALKVRFYKDGVEAIVPYLGFDASSYTVGIGHNGGGGGRFAGGVIDEVRVYGRALAPAAAESLYHSYFLPAPPVITSTPATDAYPGVAYTYAITATGSPAAAIAWSGNVAWLSFDGATLSGTPTLADAGPTATITITATNAQGTDTQQFAIDVSDAPPGLVGWWKLDDGSGTTALDSSVNANHGTLVNMEAGDWVAGRIGGALEFDGTNECVTAPRPTDAVDNWTLSVWINPTVLNQAEKMIVAIGQDQRGYGMIYGNNSGDSRLRGLYGSVTWLDSGYNFPQAATWYHVVMLRDNGIEKFIVNGQQTPAGDVSLPPNAFGGADVITLGNHEGQNRYFSGAIDDVRVYERALTASEVLNLYNAGLNLTPPAITSVAPTSAAAGVAYTYTVTATGDPAPAITVSWLPGWLVFDGTDTISGTPTAGDVGVTGTITVTAANGVNPSATQQFTIDVAGVPTAPTITSAPAGTAKAGALYTYSVTASGYPAPTFGVTGLPTWLVFDGAHTLSGTPAPGDVGVTGTITVTATNSEGSDQQQFTIDVQAAPAVTSVPPGTAVATIAYTYTIVATGTPAPTIAVSGLPVWLVFDGTDTVSGTPTPSDVGVTGTITVTAANGVAPDATQEFTIDVAAEPEAPVITSVAPATAAATVAYTYVIAATGAPTPTISVTGLPAWLVFDGTDTISGTPTDGDVGPTGMIAVTATNGINPDATQQFTIDVAAAPVAPAITSVAPTTGTVGVAYTYAVTTTGNPAPTIAVSGLPGWLAFDGTDTISGTPTAVGATGMIAVTAANGVSPDATQQFTIDVSPAPEAPAITSAAPTTATVAAAYSYTVVATGYPAPAITVAGLPAWLTFDGTDTISGTPAVGDVGATGTITVTATNSEGADTEQFTIDVAIDAPPTVAVANVAAGAVLAGTWTVIATATDDVQVTNIEFYANGALVGAGTSQGANWILRWDTTSLADGRYDLTAVARDSAGQETTSAAVSVAVVNHADDLPGIGWGDGSCVPGPGSGIWLALVCLAAAAAASRPRWVRPAGRP